MTPGTAISSQFTSAGVPQRLECGNLSILQYPGSELEAGPHQIWLRRRSATGSHAVRGLLGPASGATVAVVDGAVVARGTHLDLDWCLWWDQPADGLFGWTLRMTNTGDDIAEVDAVCTLDVALTPWDVLRRNEFYVSQYLDLTPLADGDSTILAVRQNLPGPTTPWLALSCTGAVAGWCTDARQLTGSVPGTGLDLTRDLPSTRLQHEHTLAGLQSAPLILAPGQVSVVGFRVLVVEDHPSASGAGDAEMVRTRLAEADWSEDPPDLGSGVSAVPTVFSPPMWAHGEPMDSAEFLSLTGLPAQHVETGANEEPWAYRAGAAHVVAGAKEMAVQRPHGHILVASEGPGPHDVASAVTVWMTGQVASQLTRGHADAEPLLSPRRSHLGLTLAEGVRLCVDDGHGWHLLGVPSAWAVTADQARWWWRWHGRMISVSTTIRPGELAVRAVVEEGAPLRLLLAARTDGLNGIDGVEGDAALHEDRRTRDTGWVTSSSQDGLLSFSVQLGEPGGKERDEALLDATPTLLGPPTVDRLAEFLPWLAQDALIHYQVPRGLEQFTGGAWGTRDVCQGPIGLMVAAGRLDLVREVLIVVFGAQQDDGDWPQWFEYLTEKRAPGHRESHGDIVYWPLLALGEYLTMTGDVGILDEVARWVGKDALLAPTPIREHVLAAVEHLMGQRAHDPRLPAYGHGDWNDSLQPADPDLARWMASTWTAGLEIKALSTLATALGNVEPTLASRLERIVAATEAALREQLLADGELAGYAIVKSSGVELLVHPADRRTGLTHGSLHMIHALADELFTPEEASAHLAIIDEHLAGPTGIHLFNRPVEYHGGELHMFVRAEAASFWGREIGLMYTHAHLRWVEALLRLGEADRAWEALQLVVPTGLGAAVPGAAPRQSNCYYSSIDAQFSDRWDAQNRAGSMFDPEFGFDGGWRVYSSGPGLLLRLVVEGMLGLRWQVDGVVIDPVLPAHLDGLRATVVLGGREVHVTYAVAEIGHGVRSVRINNKELPTAPSNARYREPGVFLSRHAWDIAVGEGRVDLTIHVA